VRVRSSLGRFGIVTVDAMRAILDHQDGTPTALSVYVALATHADRDEEASWRCSVKAIAEEAGVSERSVRLAKNLLVEIGLLEVAVNWTTDGDRGWDSYMIYYTPGHAPDAGGAAQDAGGADHGAGYSSDQETDQETDPPKPPKGADVEIVDVDFETFYGQYPSGRKNRQAALNRWKRLTATQRAKALEVIPDWCAYWEAKGEPDYIPAPAAWLGTKRSTHQFDSDVPRAPKKKQSSIMDSISKIRERDSQ